jgi:hypothetical protein
LLQPGATWRPFAKYVSSSAAENHIVESGDEGRIVTKPIPDIALWRRRTQTPAEARRGEGTLMKPQISINAL